MTKEVFEYRTFTRLKLLGCLIRAKQIDPQFFWTRDLGGYAQFNQGVLAGELQNSNRKSGCVLMIGSVCATLANIFENLGL
jgi:hypothetical protein